MSWVAVGLGVAQLGYGIYQNVQGSKAAKEAEANRPKYKIPLSLKRALGSAQLRSLQGMPGAIRSEMLQEMDRSRMASLAQINERRGGLGAVSQLEQTQQDSIRQIGLMDIQERNKNLQNLQQLRGVMAQQEQAAFQWDEAERYKAAAGAASAMQGAGLQNIFGGVSSVASIAASGAFSKKGTTTTTDADSIKAKGEGAKEYGVDASQMEYNKADNKWVPMQGTVNPNNANQIWTATGWGAATNITPVTPAASVNTQALNAAATQYGIGTENLELVNGTYYPKAETTRVLEGGGMEIWDSEQGKFVPSIKKGSASVKAKTIDELIAEGFTPEEAQQMIDEGAVTGEESGGLGLDSQREVITPKGDVTIVDKNNNGVADEFETHDKKGNLIDTRDGTILMTSDEIAQINNGNDQINTALQNTDETDISTNEGSLKGQLSEANQIAAAQEHGVDRGELEFVDGNWVPKHGTTNTEGLIYDSSEGKFVEPITKEDYVQVNTTDEFINGEINHNYVVPEPVKIDTENEFLTNDKGEIILDKNNNPTKNPDYVAPTGARADIIEKSKDYNIQYNEDGSIKFTESKRTSQKYLDEKYGSGSISPAELLPTDSRVKNAILGNKKGKRKLSDDRKTITTEYEHGTKTVEKTDYGHKHTYKITDKNHPLYGKEYIVKVTENPDYLGRTSPEYKELNYKLSQAKPEDKAKIQKEMDRIGDKYHYEDISGGEVVTTTGTATTGTATTGTATTGAATTWRDNKNIDSARVDRFSVQGSAGKNKANVLKDGKTIEVEVMGGLATVTGVRAEGNELIVDVEAPFGQGGAKDMGKFVESGDGYKFKPNKDIYGQLKGEDKKDFDAFVKAVESDPEFARQLLASVTGTSDFNPNEYGIN